MMIQARLEGESFQLFFLYIQNCFLKFAQDVKKQVYAVRISKR